MMQNDLTQMPYASWLEDILRVIAKENPTAIAICMRCSDGQNMTGYYGCTPEEKATMAYHIQTDAFMNVVLANADRIVRSAEEMENNEEDAEK